MENFEFCVPTHILFGKGQIEKLPDVINGFGKKVLLTYGGGSIKKTGLYDKIKELLADCEIFELSGIAPNPKVDSVREGVALCREHNIDVILAVGGGSVIDCSKGIASARYYEGDAWDMIATRAEITKALPIVTVLTIAATGSEADFGAVITNPDTNEKLALNGFPLFPKVSILDPEYTFSVPAKQTAAGSIDILSHLMEQYFVPASTYMNDLLVEAVMKTVVKYAPIAYKEPNNYEARGQLMWASTLADNATLCNGNQLVAFSCHGIEHELSAYYDITHGVGLAIVTPRWMEYVLSDKTAPKFARFGREIFNVQGDNDMESAKLTIKVLYDFFRSLGVPMSFGELGITSEHFEEMAHHAVEAEGLEYALLPLTSKDVKAIYEMCL
ncbi:MAG: iron-containing alcohol dehydrogenase [Alphaproteobacteria bacterium]|nr:iron-containing alcohol dehydrogenase [Alphaproteobacteria bacterium]